MEAIVKRNGEEVKTVKLNAAEKKPSFFQGELQVSKTGLYDVTVTAFDARTANSGVDRVTFIVSE